MHFEIELWWKSHKYKSHFERKEMLAGGLGWLVQREKMDKVGQISWLVSTEICIHWPGLSHFPEWNENTGLPNWTLPVWLLTYSCFLVCKLYFHIIFQSCYRTWLKAVTTNNSRPLTWFIHSSHLKVPFFGKLSGGLALLETGYWISGCVPLTRSQ